MISWFEVVLTLCCGARWTSCCSSSRFLLLFSLLLQKTCDQSVSHTRALPAHFNEALSFCFYSFSCSFPVLQSEVKTGFEIFLEVPLWSLVSLGEKLVSCSFAFGLRQISWDVSGKDCVLNLLSSSPIHRSNCCCGRSGAEMMVEITEASSCCGLCLRYVKLLSLPSSFYPPSDWVQNAVSPLLLHSLHPSHFLPTHQTYQTPPCFSPATPLTAHIPPLLSRTCYTPSPSPCCNGGWVLCVRGQNEAADLISWGAGKQKKGGEGQ